MNKLLTEGAPVKVVRPGKEFNGWKGRAVEVEALAAWVAFKDKGQELPGATDAASLRKLKLRRFPLSQLQHLNHS